MHSSTAITLDATHFGAVEPTGVERYVEALLPLLTTELQLLGVRVAWVGHGEPPIGMPENAAWLSSPHRRFWSQTGLSQLLKQTQPDLFFTPSGIPPFRTSIKTAMTVHDLGIYEFPEAYSLGQRVRLGMLSRQVATKATQIIVPSQYTANQITSHWKIAESAISVIPEGFTPNTALEKAIPQLSDLPFFLYVGRLERKKNLEVLLQGFEKLVAEQKGIRLVLAGGQGYGYAALQKAIARLSPDAEARVIEAGYVSEGEKRWLYAHASAGIVPCPFEGFGLPVLDCFEAGIPVVCAKAGALPEVGSDAGIYVQPDSPTDWYLQMRAVLTGSIETASLISKGKKYLELYTWQRAAERTAETLVASL